MENNFFRDLCTVCVPIAAALLLQGCSDGRMARKDGAVGKEPVAVKVMTVGVTDNMDSDMYVGTVRPSKSTVISCPYAGKLVSLGVREGQIVGEGDELGRINSQSVISMRDMAAASLEQARDGYRRAQPVYEKGSMAEVKWMEIKTRLAQAEASAESADKALDDCTLRAPYGGVIGKVYADEGVDLKIASPVVQVMDISSPEIEFPVPESEIGAMSVGDKVRVCVPALANRSFEGRVTVKGISASALSHSYTCTLVPVGKVDGLLPGMVCKVSVGRADNGIVIPASVVRPDTEGHYVWIVRDGKAEKAGIRTGDFSGQGVTVLSGLGQGDLLIVEGAQKVSSGMEVKIVR